MTTTRAERIEARGGNEQHDEGDAAESSADHRAAEDRFPDAASGLGGIRDAHELLVRVEPPVESVHLVAEAVEPL
jgi:hypothetical protein